MEEHNQDLDEPMDTGDANEMNPQTVVFVTADGGIEVTHIDRNIDEENEDGLERLEVDRKELDDSAERSFDSMVVEARSTKGIDDYYDIIAQIWLESSPKEVASKLITLDWFRKLVPKFYSPQKSMNCLQLEFDDDQAREALIDPLEKYIFNNEEPKEYFEKLEKIVSPESLCGRVFKPGEPTYGCRDCGLDPTCVLCVDCFKQSAHQNHRYKISTSSGGGYCDCGDNEAWKNDFYCETHNPEASEARGTSLDSIQPGLRDRIDLILSIVIGYCFSRFVDHNVVLSNELTLTDSEVEELGLKYSDFYCTTLYNDESHTFEVVIQTLQKAINCTKKEAIEYATMIDREGRSLVKISDFAECVNVKKISEKQTSRAGQQPLKILVLHSFVVAHQIFALKLMDWVKQIVSYSAEIREIFYDVMTRTTDLTRPHCDQEECARQSYLSGIIRSDTEFWKAQRSACHNLIIAGLLRDYEMKKKFAVEFTKGYPQLFKDFITDDHDHAISITSLSVQIYTVPTIAHYLLEHHNVVFTIMRTFVSEFEQKLNAESKLQLQRSPNGPFKRAQYAILDVKYLLTNPPSEWTDELRKPFIHGVSCIVKLLGWMQEMDPIVRQTGAHMEYEPEWETAFNFHIKLAPIINLVQQWSSTDEQVCIRAYRYALHQIHHVYASRTPPTCCRELVNHSATCYEYDVLSKEVSIHLPLTRFAAGFHLLFDKFGLNFNSPQFNMDQKPTPLLIMEPSLRMLVLQVQSHVGLWKRNGFALLNQLYFYHNVKCRGDMMDKDILCLQLGASLIESNEYLLHLLNRFGLMAWAESDFDDKPSSVDDDSGRHFIGIAEQFFTLINTLISARYFVGVSDVTEKECVQNEIIQFLCKEPMTHSALNKVLVENVNSETGLEEYIHEVATFKTNKTNKGGFTYELKPEFYDQYDVFHYHFSHEEMQTAEERQRNRKKAAQEPEFFAPPKLPLFTEQFSLVPNLLKSDVLLSLMALVMKRALKKSSRSFSDPQLRMVLHLIGQGLNEEATRNEIERDHFFQFTAAAKHWEIFGLLEKLLHEHNCAHHREFILWMFRQYHALKPAEDLSLVQTVGQISQAEEETQRKKKLAAAIREKRLAEMNAAQKNFYSVNADLFREDEAKAEVVVPDTEVVSDNIALGLHQSKRTSGVETRICILCHCEESLSEAKSVFVLCALVQRSTVMAQCRDVHLVAEQAEIEKTYLMQRNPLLLQPDLAYAPHVSCCGHAMHSACWKKHFEGIVTKERRRPYRHPSSFDVDSGEYLCPMCGCLSNTTLMVVEPCFLVKENEVLETEECNKINNFGTWIGLWSNVLKNKVAKGQRHRTHPYNQDVIARCKENSRSDELRVWEVSPNSELKELEKYYFMGKIPNQPRVYPVQTNDESPKSFLTTVYTVGLDTGIDFEPDYRLPLMTWQAISYTIMAHEANYSELGLPFFGKSVPTRLTETMNCLARGGSVLTQYAQAQLSSGDSPSQGTIQSHALKLMEALMNGSGPGSSFRQPCILEFDAFTALVSMTYASQYVFMGTEIKKDDLGGSDTVCLKDLFLLRLVTMVHMAQIIMSNPSEGISCDGNVDNMTDDGWEALDNTLFALACKHVWNLTGIPYSKRMYWPGVWEAVTKAMIPFLRCAAKFYECLTGITPGKQLESPTNSFKDLVRYLDLPATQDEYFADFGDFSFSTLVMNPTITDILTANQKYRAGGSVPRVPMITYPRTIGSFTELPTDYAALINSVSLFSCQNCDDNESRTPTMCLICGAILCSQSYCCQYQFGSSPVGACTYHAYFCGGGIGIFLRIRECKVFYLYSRTKGAFIFPPYLDAYGETDQGLRRGNPMSLCLEKYDNYRRSWMLHTIPEEIARITEHSTTITIAEWQYL